MYEMVNTCLTFIGFIAITFFGVEGFLKWSCLSWSGAKV